MKPKLGYEIHQKFNQEEKKGNKKVSFFIIQENDMN
jgi:hypothetical protein